MTNIWTDVEAIKGIFFKTLEEQQTQTKFTVSNVAFERSIIEAAPHESRPQIFRNSDSHCENAVHSAVNVIICGVCQEILNLSVFVSALTHPSACDASRLLMLQLSYVKTIFHYWYPVSARQFVFSTENKLCNDGSRGRISCKN